MTKTSRSEELFARAEKVIPGGVNSPVRAFKAVGGVPRFIKRGRGACVYDADGTEYLDYVGSWGPLIFGHASHEILNNIAEVMDNGTSFGAPTEGEIELAELLTSLIPGFEMVRLVSSGTEATMSAVRLARGFTGRDRIIKFNGCYHGHSDSLLVAAGSGVAAFGVAGSPGIPEQVAALSASIEFNDISLFRKVLNTIGPDTVAAVIIEPVPGNMGLVLPQEGYLEDMRSLCTKHGIVLIFDEVMSGFRVALGGAAERYGVIPDLCTFGKVIGGGLPVGAFGGRSDIMQYLAPAGPVYQAGTLSGNPLAVTAGLAQLRLLRDRNPYPQFKRLAMLWANGMSDAAKHHGISLKTAYCGSMLGLFFSDSKVSNFTEAKASDTELYGRFFHGMLEEGIYMAPSAFEAGFLSTAHTHAHIEQTIAAAERVFARIIG